VAAAIAGRPSANLRENLEASVSLLATVFAAVLFGPLQALVVAAASMLARRVARLRLAQATDSQFDTSAVAAYAAILAGASEDHSTLGLTSNLS
jgi:hypothetical protein